MKRSFLNRRTEASDRAVGFLSHLAPIFADCSMGRKAAAATTGDLKFNPFSKCRSSGHVSKIIGFKL